MRNEYHLYTLIVVIFTALAIIVAAIAPLFFSRGQPERKPKLVVSEISPEKTPQKFFFKDEKGKYTWPYLHLDSKDGIRIRTKSATKAGYQELLLNGNTEKLYDGGKLVAEAEVILEEMEGDKWEDALKPVSSEVQGVSEKEKVLSKSASRIIAQSKTTLSDNSLSINLDAGVKSKSVKVSKKKSKLVKELYQKQTFFATRSLGEGGAATPQRLIWQIQLKDFDITADNADVKPDSNRKEYNQTIIDVSDYNGQIRWQEIAATDTIRIYFDEQGTTKAIEIDPLLTVTEAAPLITVDDGTRKWVFDSTGSVQAPNLFFHTSVGAGADNIASTYASMKAIGPIFDTAGLLTSTAQDLVENTPTRVKVNVQGTYGTSPTNINNTYTIYPTGEAFLAYNVTTVGSTNAEVVQHYLNATPQVQNHDNTVGTGHAFVQSSDTSNNNYPGMSVVPYTSTEFGAEAGWAVSNSAGSDYAALTKAVAAGPYAGSMVIDFSNYRATTTTRDNLKDDYRTPATLTNPEKGSIVGDGYDEGEGAYTWQADGSGDAKFDFTKGAPTTRYKPAFKITSAGRPEDNYKVKVNGVLKTKGVDYNLSKIDATTVIVQWLSDVTTDLPNLEISGETGVTGAQIAVGWYTGDGADPHVINTVGFQPDLVIIKSQTTAQYAVFKTSDMAGDTTLELANAAGVFADGIQSLDALGFTLGADARVNENGITFHWQAFKKNGSTDFATGTYAGNGADNRNVVTGLNFQPAAVVVKDDGASQGVWRPSSLEGDLTLVFSGNYAADRIQSLTADGFTVGTDAVVNSNGETYYWFALAEVPGWIDVGSYTGDGTDSRSITGVGFQPSLVWIKLGWGGTLAVSRPSTLGGDSTLSLSSNDAEPNLIQGLEADGFQVGNNLAVNYSGRTQYYLAVKAGTTATSGNKIWDGGGVNDNWSTADNWSDNIAPVASDSVVFGPTSTDNCIIDTAQNVASITIGSGYTGTITANAGLTVNGDFSLEQGTYNANGQALNIGGSFSRVGGTFTHGNNTTTFNATATGKTILSGGQSFGTLTFNGSGGGWTLQDNITATNLTITTGTLTDNGKQVTVNGNISIANTASLLTSTGTWTQGASGDISNPLSGNRFRYLTIAGAGVTTTLTSNVEVGSTTGVGGTLTMGSGTLNGGNYTLGVFATVSDAVTTSSLSVGTSLANFWIDNMGYSVNQKAMTFPNNFATLIKLWPYNNNITATGDWNFGNNNVQVSTYSAAAPTKYIDMASYALTAGNLYLGNNGSSYNGYIKLGSSAAHSVADLKMQLNAGTGNLLDMGSSITTASGDVDFTNITVTKGSSTLIMSNGANKNLVGNLQTLNNLTISGTVTVTYHVFVSSTLIVDPGKSLTINAGYKVTMNNGSTTTLNGTITGAGLLRLYDSAGASLSTGGILSSLVEFNAKVNADIAVPERTYGGGVTFLNEIGSSRTATLGTAGSQTLNFSSGFTVQTAAAGTMTVKADTWNPTVNITGSVSFTNGGGTPSITQYSGASPNAWAIGGNLTLAGGSISMGSVTMTVTGNVDFTNGTVTQAGVGKLIMNGESKTIKGNGQTLRHLQISNNIATATSSISMEGSLTVDNSMTLNIADGTTVTMKGGANTILNGTIASAGTGTLILENNTGGLSTTGILSSAVTFYDSGVNITIPARTYGGAVVVADYGPPASSYNATLGTAGSQTLNFSSTFNVFTTNTSSITIKADTWNPTVNITGDVTFTKSSSGVPSITMYSGVDAGSPWTIGGNLTLANGSINMGKVTTTVSGDVDLTTTGTFTAGTSTLKMDGLNKVLTGASQTLNNLQISNDISQSGDLNISGTLTVDDTRTYTGSSNLTMWNGSTTTIIGTITGSFNFRLRDGAGANLSTTGTITCSDLFFQTSTTDVVVPARTYGAGIVHFYNSTTTSRTVTLGTGPGQTLVFSGWINTYVDNTGNLTVDGAANNPAINAGTVIFSKGFSGIPSINMGTNTIWSVAGSVDFRNGDVDEGSSTLKFTSTALGKTIWTDGEALNNIDFDGVGGGWTLQDDLSTNGYLKITNGTVDATNRTLNIAGDFNRAGGTFTTTGSTVNLTGGDGSNQLISGSTTFNNLSADASGSPNGRIINFASGSTQTISGALNLTGIAGRILTLRSSNPTNQWLITPNGARTVSYVDVQDSNNTLAGNHITAEHSHNAGNNTNWDFPANTLTWTGSGGTSWVVGGSWNDGYVPNDTDSAIIANVAQKPVLLGDAAINDVAINTDSSLDLNSHDLTVGGTLTNNALLKLTGDENDFAATNAVDSIVEYTAVGGSRNIKNWTYANLTISGGGTFILPGNITVNQKVTLAGGTLDLGVNTLNVKGDWERTVGSLSNGTVNFNGMALQGIVSGGQAFNNLTVSNGSAAGVDFADATTINGILYNHTASSKMTFANSSSDNLGTVDLLGTDGDVNNNIKFRSDTPGVDYDIGYTAITNIDYLDIQDANNTGAMIVVDHARDGGGNIGWYLTDDYALTATTPQEAGAGWSEAMTAEDFYDSTATSDSVTVVNMTASSPTVKFFTDVTYTVQTLTYTLAGGTKTIYIRDDNMGDETITYTATDTFGTTKESGNIFVGNTAPVSSVTLPVNGSTVGAGTVQIKGTASDASGGVVSEVRVRIQKGGSIIIDWTAVTNTGVNFSTWAYDWDVLTGGDYTIQSRAKDSLGLEEVPGAGVTITISTGMPSVKITSPTYNQWVTSVPFEVSGTATAAGASSISSMKISINNSVWRNATNTGSNFSTWRYSWNPADGKSYLIRARARDNANQSSAIYSVRVGVDTRAPTKPSALLAKNVSNLALSDLQVFLSWGESSDATSGMKGYEIIRDGEKIGESKVSESYYVDEGVEAGDRMYQVKAIDNVGLQSTSDPKKATIEEKTGSGEINDISVIPSEISTPDGKTMAQVTWKTNNPATSQVQYGLGASKAQVTSEDTNLNSGHSMVIPDLNTETKYHFVVISKDNAGNELQSDDQNFTTLRGEKEKSLWQSFVDFVLKIWDWIRMKIFKPVGEFLHLIKPEEEAPALRAFDVSNVEAGKYQNLISVVNKDEFTLERSEDGEKFTKLALVSGKDWYVDSQVEAGKTYFYKVKNLVGVASASPATGKSAPVNEDISQKPIIVQLRAKELTVGTKKAEIEIRWQTDQLTTSKVSIDGREVGDDNLNQSHTIVVSDLKPNTSYQFTVGGQNKGGQKADAKKKSISVPPPAKDETILETMVGSLRNAAVKFIHWLRN